MRVPRQDLKNLKSLDEARRVVYNVGVNVIESPVLLFYVLVWVSTFYLWLFI